MLLFLLFGEVFIDHEVFKLGLDRSTVPKISINGIEEPLDMLPITSAPVLAGFFRSDILNKE